MDVTVCERISGSCEGSADGFIAAVWQIGYCSMDRRYRGCTDVWKAITLTKKVHGLALVVGCIRGLLKWHCYNS